MYLVINKWVIAVSVSDFSGQYLRDWTLDIGVLGYIGIVWPKEHSPLVWSVPPVTPCIKCKSKFPLQAQLWPRGIALLFHDHCTRRGWVVSSTPRPYFTPGKDPVPIVHEAGWAPGPGWTGGKSRATGIRSPDRPVRSQSLYRLSYPAHTHTHTHIYIYIYIYIYWN